MVSFLQEEPNCVAEIKLVHPLSEEKKKIDTKTSGFDLYVYLTKVSVP